MTHEEARTLASARLDGELFAAAPLDDHLSSCDECRAFASGIERLGALARLLPSEKLPAGFEERMRSVVSPRQLRPRLQLRISAVVAAAAVAVLVVVGGLPVRTFRVTPAEAASALLRIRSLDVTRSITLTEPDGAVTRIDERIRWRAPGSTRVDRTTTTPDGKTTRQVEIRLPGTLYRAEGSSRSLTNNLPPDRNPVPEPLSPTVALLGTRDGPGPNVAGRATVRVTLTSPQGTTRTVLIDATRASVLSSDTNVVLSKQTSVVLSKDRVTLERVTSKRVSKISYNPRLDDSVFAIPRGVEPVDDGFKPRPPEFLRIRPRATPAGFALVRSGTSVNLDAILYSRGAFTILVQVSSSEPQTDEQTVEYPASVAGRSATVYVGLYDLPAIQFTVDGRSVTISAPMTPSELQRIASVMFPAE